MLNPLITCTNCGLYDDGGCHDMQMGMVPEQCQLFEPVEVLSRRRDLITVRGMTVRVGMDVLSAPNNTLEPLRDEELRGKIINIRA